MSMFDGLNNALVEQADAEGAIANTVSVVLWFTYFIDRDAHDREIAALSAALYAFSPPSEVKRRDDLPDLLRLDDNDIA